MKTIIIDPGHGGTDPGALSPHVSNLAEKDVNLRTALHLKSLLHGTFRVILTRNTDVDMDLSDRVAVANQFGGNEVIYISIHANSATNHMARGGEVWTSRGETKADTLAGCVIESWRGRFSPLPFRFESGPTGPDREAGFYVLRKTECPAILVELGFLTNREDAALLNDDEWLLSAAGAIAEGIFVYYDETVPEPTSTDPEPFKPTPVSLLLTETISKLETTQENLLLIQKALRNDQS